MAAGKIFLAAKKVQRRRYKRSGFAKKVSAIARKSVMRMAETKTGNLPYFASQFGSNGLFGPGIWSALTQGTAQNQRVGDKVQAVGVKFRGYINVDTAVFTTAITQSQTGFRLLVVSGKRLLTSGDMPSYSGFIDPEVLTVHHDSYIRIGNQSTVLTINKYIKFRRNIQYSGGTAVKNDLWAFIIPPPVGPLTTTTGYGSNVNAQLYYKDI